MADQNVRGRFVWHELATPDQPGALTFYARTLGWKKVPWEQDPNYSMFAAESGPLGGAGAAAGGTARWTPFIGVADIDATVRQAESLGAAVATPVTRIPEAGKYAVLTDPQGAAFGVHWAAEGPGPERTPGLGEFSWHELAALDCGAAFDFYAALFEWDKLAEHDMGPMGVYLIFGRNGTQWGGMFTKGNGGLPGSAYWLGYVRVRDVHATVGKIEAAGGKLAVGPMEVPGGDWVAQCLDPAGALFAVHTLAADLKAARPAPPKKSAAKKTGAKKTAAKKKGGKKKTAKKSTKKPATKKASKTKAAKKKTAKKKTAKKKVGAKKKAASKKAAKKAAPRKTGKKKTAKQAAKKSAKRKSAKRKPAKKKSAKKKSVGRKASGRKKAKAAKRKTVAKKAAKKTAKKGKRKRAAAKKR